MSQFINLLTYEFKMSIRRRGLWVSFGMVCLFFLMGFNTTSGEGLLNHISGRDMFLEAAETVFTLNMLTPLMAGILASDRLQRDLHLNTRELQNSTPAGNLKIILAKYFGVFASIFIVGFIFTLIHGAVSIFILKGPLLFIFAEAVVFFVMIGPAYAFVIAFSLGCPLVMPLRVYQILFTGYWVWGNLLTSRLVPSISNTLLNASGMFALQGFYGSVLSPVGEAPHTAAEAWINIVIILLCATAMLLITAWYMNWKQKRA